MNCVDELMNAITGYILPGFVKCGWGEVVAGFGERMVFIQSTVLCSINIYEWDYYIYND